MSEPTSPLDIPSEDSATESYAIHPLIVKVFVIVLMILGHGIISTVSDMLSNFDSTKGGIQPVKDGGITFLAPSVLYAICTIPTLFIMAIAGLEIEFYRLLAYTYLLILSLIGVVIVARGVIAGCKAFHDLVLRISRERYGYVEPEPEAGGQNRTEGGGENAGSEESVALMDLVGDHPEEDNQVSHGSKEVFAEV